MKRYLFFLLLALASGLGLAQETYPVNGVHDIRDVYHAFINARIHIAPGNTVDSARLIMHKGKVVFCGRAVDVPPGSVIHDCTGLTIYPSFIDAYAGFLYEKPKKGAKKEPSVVNTATNWNPAIHPEHEYSLSFPVDKKIREDWLAGGIGIVNHHDRDGIMRGTGSLFFIGLEQANQALILPKSSAHFSFNKGSSTFDYPSSHMGAIALIRQTMYDAQWYAQAADRSEVNASLNAINELDHAPSIFELNHPLSYRNVEDLSAEFGTPFILKGTGKEYLIAEHLSGPTRFILPTDFPRPFNIADPFDARMISLHELKHWEAAPYNPYFLTKGGHQIALTRDTIKSHKAFLAGLKKIARSGLIHDQVLAALTTTPATFLGVERRLGTLEAGKLASFFISEGDFTSSGFEVISHWSKGERVYNIERVDASLIGAYNLVIEKADYLLDITSVGAKGVEASIKKKGDDSKLKASVTIQDELITLVIMNGEENRSLLYQLSGKFSLGGTLVDGTGTDARGAWHSWAGVKDRNSDVKKSSKTAGAIDSLVYYPRLRHPNVAFGWDSLVGNNSFAITNAVIWTCADTGKLEGADVWVENGKIKRVGSGMLYPSGLKRIDAKGRHLTPGMIDEHSHIGLRGGVNEWAQASSAEVRIEDALDPWSAHIYRHRAGGVTSAQLLHGSANPIGGQSALIKLKWGMGAKDMLIGGADGFIKFALGENVKRANSKDNKGRFPLTRMGVEQSFIDAFTRAREYDVATSTADIPARKSLSKTSARPVLQRRDLELDALVEILHQERFITCHSYVQSEILMLMSVADSFDFKVNTFTHILEGYKVAPQLAAHGASGSTFSDWWAYKFEVNDAIPYNAALMSRAGVNTSINSDDAEMGRRLNQEAAKTMKYGGVSEEEALKMVTINPARMLHLDHRVGSIEVGKDADFVLWSGPPLSVYAHPEQTFIEGVKYFDVKEQEGLNADIAAERARLIEKMLQEKGEKKRAITAKKEREYHCDTILENYDQE
ncbi:MAG: amidohydrolase family protein [Cryomorphaceae bacterium]